METSERAVAVTHVRDVTYCLGDKKAVKIKLY